MNKEGILLLECVEESGWNIFNEMLKGDEDGEFTYTGFRGNTVIDYGG